MARRDLLNDDERRRLFGLPESEAELIRHYTLTSADLELAADRRGAHNRLRRVVTGPSASTARRRTATSARRSSKARVASSS